MFFCNKSGLFNAMQNKKEKENRARFNCTSIKLIISFNIQLDVSVKLHSVGKYHCKFII